MRIDELVDKLNDLDCFAIIRSHNIEITNGGRPIATIRMDNEMMMSNCYYRWNCLDDDKKEAIIDLLFKFIKTRIEDR